MSRHADLVAKNLARFDSDRHHAFENGVREQLPAVPCPTCQGRGTVWPQGALSFVACEDCRGAGRIVVGAPVPMPGEAKLTYEQIAAAETTPTAAQIDDAIARIRARDAKPATDARASVEEPPRAGFANAADALAYLLAGRAVVTLVSEVTGARFTFRVSASRMSDQDARLFVSLLTGPENTSDFTYVGTIFDRSRYAHGRKSRVGPDAPSARAFAWAFRHLVAGCMPPGCLVYHEGRCGRCGRALTDPESIEIGLGPKCGARP